MSGLSTIDRQEVLRTAVSKWGEFSRALRGITEYGTKYYEDDIRNHVYEQLRDRSYQNNRELKDRVSHCSHCGSRAYWDEGRNCPHCGSTVTEMRV